MPLRTPAPLSPLTLAAASFLAVAVAAGPLTALAGELHEVSVAPTKAAVGAKGKASVTLAGKNGWHLNEQAPISVKLTPGAGVTLDKPKLVRKDAAEANADKARFDVAFTAAEPGAKTIDADCSFVICQEAACKQIKEKVTLALDVTPAGEAAKPATKQKKK
jgi:hypothetical protein